jgi:undecaprenyl-diphosphatase
MDAIQALILGLLQGIAEFLPISSSGHLTLAGDAFGIEEPPILLSLCLHVATLLVILLHFRRKIISVLFPLNIPYIRAIFLASIPTAILGLLLKTYGGSLFTAGSASAFLIINGIFLIWLSRREKRQDESSMADSNGSGENKTPAPEAPSVFQALSIGLVQGLAALPGISRSGSTIGVARILGLPPGLAAEFSLLVSVPAIAGAALLESRHLDSLANPSMVLLGSAVAAVSGWFSVKILLRIVHKHAWFGWGLYCMVAGLVYGVMYHA